MFLPWLSVAVIVGQEPRGEKGRKEILSWNGKTREQGNIFPNVVNTVSDVFYSIIFYRNDLCELRIKYLLSQTLIASRRKILIKT